MSRKEFIRKNRGRATAISAALLAVLYISVLFLLPNVILEYKLYYTQGRLTEWPGYGGLRYTPG